MAGGAATVGVDPPSAGDVRRRILVFPAGTEIGLEIHAGLRWCRGVEVVGAGDPAPNHGQFAFPAYHQLPSVDEPGWLQALAGLVVAQRVDHVFPAHDEVIAALAAQGDGLPFSVIGSPPATALLTRSKSATYAALADVVRVPKVYPSREDVTAFPVFVKPDRGQGARGAQIARDPVGLASAVQDAGGDRLALICEHLPGDEYTVDCFSSRRDGLLFVGARQRRRVRNGIAVNSVVVDLAEARAIAEAIGTRIELHGAWFFQLKRDAQGALVLLEVAPRIAGTMGLHRAAGVNFAWLSVLEREGARLEVAPIRGVLEVDRALCSRFRHTIRFSSLYIDLDDTLIFEGRVNPELIALVFRAINDGKEVVLITRHAGDLDATLARHRLAGLFDRIVHVPVGRHKHEFIPRGDAVFIDDSFSERQSVARECGIPTIDASMADLLNHQAPLDGGADR